MFCIPLLVHLTYEQFMNNMFLCLIFICMMYWWNWGIEFQKIMVLVLICGLESSTIFFMKLGVWCLCVYNCYIFLMDWYINKNRMNPFPPLISFGLKSILPNTRIIVSACFLVPFAWNILILLFVQRQYLSFMAKFISWRSERMAPIFWSNLLVCVFFRVDLRPLTELIINIS